MNETEIFGTVRLLSTDEQIQWMIDLGYQLTVYARGAYPIGEASGSLNQLLGFNEIQHQIYGRIRTLRRGDEWTLESFLESLMQKAEHYGLTRDLEAALQASRALNGASGMIQ